MCDGSDENQQLLEKLSRQISELTSSGSSHINEVPPPGIGRQWTQASGLSPEDHPHPHHPPPFSPLYTWDPAFLHQAPSSGSSPRHLSSPSFNLQDSSSVASSFPFPPPGHDSHVGHRGNVSPDPLFSSHEFQVLGDLSGRFSNLPTSPSVSQHYHPIQPPQYDYHHSQTPIVGRSFAPASPQKEKFPNLSGVNRGDSPPLNSRHSFDLHHQGLTVNNQHLHDGGLEHVHNRNNSCDIGSPNPFFSSPPSFDPRTPPPAFPLQRQLSDSANQTVVPPSSSTEFLDFLRLHSDPCINLDLDLGATNNKSSAETSTWQSFPVPVQNENTSTSEEGKQLYTEALSKWNSFDFVGIEETKPVEDNFSPSIEKEECVPESAVQSQDSPKPSYSDIAKTPKAAATSSPKIEQTNSDSTLKSKFVTKDGKPYRPLIQRTISASKFWPKGSSDRVIDQPKVSPTSRYGLDSFDDSPAGVVKNTDSSGNPTKSKRSGSSAAVLEDLSLNMVNKNGVNDNVENIPTKDVKFRPDQKTKSNVMSEQGKVNTMQSSSMKTPSVSSPGSGAEEKLFFDPKRIFQTKNTNKSRTQPPTQKSSGKSNTSEKNQLGGGDTVLNNGKPTPSSFKLPTAARQHDYINNDLRDTNKVTNKTAAEGAQSTTSHDKNDEAHTKQKETSRSSSGKRSSGGRTNGSYPKEKRKMEDDVNYKYTDAQNGHRFLAANIDRDKLEKIFSAVWEKLTIWSCYLFAQSKTLLFYTLGIVLFLTYGAVQLTWYMISKCWGWIKAKVYSKLGKTTSDSSNWKSKESTRRRIGLEEKITLPSTGEEAMNRLLACKGKDPYSILGVRQDSSDEDIKRYYRKQAMLVHPDKNQEPGAEESFKILGHAFEKIGEPGKRKEYDTQALVESESELRKEFADLISKLQTKIQEAANLMPCDNCGKKHRRIPVDRPIYSARFCQRCNIRHSAKEGDVWAESTMLGFYWNYYALMEGHVYDITEWMKCHHEFYKRMGANEHTVLTRIATDGNKKTKHHHNREANLAEFINRFFPKMPGQPGAGPGQTSGGGGGGGQPPPGSEHGWGQGSGSAAGKKTTGGKRKKKRH